MKFLLRLLSLLSLLSCNDDDVDDVVIEEEELIKVDNNDGGDDEIFLEVDIENLADDIGLINYGQSLSVSGQGLLNEEELKGCFNFNGGTFVNYDITDDIVKNAFYGSNYSEMNSEGKETPAKGQCVAVKKLLKNENNFDIVEEDKRLIAFSAGVFGAPLSQLSNTSGVAYLRLIESITKANEISLSEGRTFEVGAFSYIQGENGNDRDNSTQEHFDLLSAFFKIINTDVKNITKQDKDVQFFVYQIASHSAGEVYSEGVPLAFTKLVDEIDNINFGSSMYQYEYLDGIHLTDEFNTTMGVSFGAAIKKVIFDLKPYNELNISNHKVFFENNMNKVELNLDVPYLPLVVNTELIPKISNYGFSILNVEGEELITNVEVNESGKIYLTCSENPFRLDLTYSIEGYETQGNITDSMNLEYTRDGFVKSIDNYLPSLRLNLINGEDQVSVSDKDAENYINTRTNQFTSIQNNAINNYVVALKNTGLWNKLDNIHILTEDPINAAINMKSPSTTRFKTGGETYSVDGADFSTITSAPTIISPQTAVSGFFLAFNNTTKALNEGHLDVGISLESFQTIILGRRASFDGSSLASFYYEEDDEPIVGNELDSENIGLVTGNRRGLDMRGTFNNSIYKKINTKNATATFTADRVFQIGVYSDNVNESTSTKINFIATASKGLTDSEQDNFTSITNILLSEF